MLTKKHNKPDMGCSRHTCTRICHDMYLICHCIQMLVENIANKLSQGEWTRNSRFDEAR